MTHKERLSVTVDADLLTAGKAAVDAGRADSLSSWVNDAMQLRADHDRRMQALDAFIEAYEAEHGEISDDEIAAAKRRTRSRAVVVRTEPVARPSARKRRA